MAASYSLEFQLAPGVWTPITDVTDAPIMTSHRFQSAAVDDLVMGPPTLSFGLNNAAFGSGGVISYYSPDSSNCRSGFTLGMLVRLRVTANGTTRTRFYGWLESIDPKPGLYDDQTVACTAVGWLGQAATTGISGLSAVVSQRDDQLLAALVALSPLQPFATSFTQGIETYPYAFHDLDPVQNSVLDGIDSTCKSGFYRVVEKPDGTLVGQTRLTRQGVPTTVLALTDVAPGGQPGLALTTLPGGRRRSSVQNRYQVTVHPARVDSGSVVLYALPLASNPSLGFGETVTLQAPFVDPGQPSQQISGVHMLISDGSIGAVVGTSGNLPTADYQFTTLPNGGGADVSSQVAVTVSYGANQANLTIVNSYPGTVYYAKLQCRGSGIYDYQPVISVAQSSTSQNAVGQNTIALNCPYQATPTFAGYAATWALANGAPDRTQLDQGVQLFVTAGDDVTMDALFALNISDPVTISETVKGLAAGTYWINGIDCTFDERCNATFTFTLAMNINIPVWLAGVSKAGTETYPAF